MDVFLGRVTQQAMNYAIRNHEYIRDKTMLPPPERENLPIATTKLQDADNQQTVEGSQNEELAFLQDQLDHKISIISPAIDMIELIAARGNTSLESAVRLTKSLRWEIQSLGVRISKVANEEELAKRRSARARSETQNEADVRQIAVHIRKVLKRIEDAVPLINLAISTSGASLSTSLPQTVSPSRLLQASTFLIGADSQFSVQPGRRVQVGPTFTLSLYMLFSGHAQRLENDEGTLREMIWKEVIHKAKVKLYRVPLVQAYDSPDAQSGPQAGRHSTEGTGFAEPIHMSGIEKADEFAYQLLIVEDLEDGRVHTFEEDEPQPRKFEDVPTAGILEILPIHEISKIFYADTGKILNIGAEGEPNSSVLLLKRDVSAEPPRKMMERSMRPSYLHLGAWNQEVPQDTSDDVQWEINDQLSREQSSAPQTSHDAPPESNAWRLPKDLDPEWLAFEVFTEEPDSEGEEDSRTETDQAATAPRPTAQNKSSSETNLTSAFSSLNLKATASPVSDSSSARAHETVPSPQSASESNHAYGPVRTSLSLLEMLIRLTSLQQFQQASQLCINDELLNFFLSEAGTTGAGGDSEERRRKRQEARRKVGFDPYDESPVKWRGEADPDTVRSPLSSSHGASKVLYEPFSSVDSPFAPELPSSQTGYDSPKTREDFRGSIKATPIVATPSSLNFNNTGSRESTPSRSPIPFNLQSTGKFDASRATNPSKLVSGRSLSSMKATALPTKKGSPLTHSSDVAVSETDKDSSLGTSPGAEQSAESFDSK